MPRRAGRDSPPPGRGGRSTLHEIERAGVHHIAVGKPKLDWSALIEREKNLIKDIPANLARSMERRGVEVIRGLGAFAGPNLIRVGNRHLEAKHIVIATGSKPRPLPIPGAELMITSEEMLSERRLPGSVIFVGGGVISLEFGHVYARTGAQVMILEALRWRESRLRANGSGLASGPARTCDELSATTTACG